MSSQEPSVSVQGNMKTLLAYLETPVLIVSTHYKTAYINPAFESIFNIAFKDSLGKDISDFMMRSSAESLKEAGEESKIASKPLRIAIHEANNYYSVGVSPILNEEGKSTGLVFNFMDITKERQLDQMKADLISLLLNDLRAPIIHIGGIFDELKQGADPESNVSEAVTYGMEVVKELIDKLEQMLHVTDSIAGDLKLARTELKPDMLISMAHNSLAPLAKKSSVTVEHFIAGRLPDFVCDREKIMQVFIFMLTEQIKAAGHGGTVSFGAGVTFDQDRPAKLIVSAAQTSITWSRSDMPELYGDNGAQSADPTKVAVKKIIEAHGGDFSIFGLEGHGCSITVSFPYNPA